MLQMFTVDIFYFIDAYVLRSAVFVIQFLMLLTKHLEEFEDINHTETTQLCLIILLINVGIVAPCPLPKSQIVARNMTKSNRNWKNYVYIWRPTGRNPTQNPYRFQTV